MLNQKYFNTIKQEIVSYAEKRREVIKTAGDALHAAKKAIFALHRDNAKEAKENLDFASSALIQLTKKYAKDRRLFDEGSFHAATEEYVEAVLFKQFLDSKDIGPVPGLTVAPEDYISGLCDVPGEISRYAIKSATERNFAMVKKCYTAAEQIVHELLNMNLTGYHRQKFDQAKQVLHKLQQTVYEVSLKG